ncbi:hypothetical protein K492DRAFT_172809 [Lichtheimia hyalospora FSU 10163]|nr:hypothetical protein K492DRAFT_172809 [Lichtheimia hyalospora FSU 10163]
MSMATFAPHTTHHLWDNIGTAAPNTISSSSSSSSSSSNGSISTLDDLEHIQQLEMHGFPTRPGPDDWKFALDGIRQEMYSTTGAGLPSPANYFERIMRAAVIPDAIKADVSMSDDISAYRKARSERLVMRLFHCMGYDKSNVMCLSPGVYVHNKWQQDYSNATLDDIVFGNLQFTPFSYTFGARYTDAYGYASDIVIRGNLPVWVQSLFLAECVRQNQPVRAGDTRSGLFTFAPAVAVQFQSLQQQSSVNPELALAYERIALELVEPDMLLTTTQTLEEEESIWNERVIEKMLICNIPDSMAQILTEMATAWASSQGFPML